MIDQPLGKSSRVAAGHKAQVLQKLLLVTDQIRDIDPEMPLQQVRTLLEVALRHEAGINVSELTARVGNSVSATSRNVSILGEHGRGNTPARLLLKTDVNPKDRRSLCVHLSPKGERVIKRIVAVLDAPAQ